MATTSSSSSTVITPEDVLESLMNDGTIDALRLKIINQLKANEELKSTTIKMAEQSKVLNAPGAEKQTKRELFDALRQELETPILEKASKSAWELILEENGLGKEITETVERVFCRLSGSVLPLFPIPDGEIHPVEEALNENEKGKDEEENKNEKEASSVKSKKRGFNEITAEAGGADDVASRSGDSSTTMDNSSKSPQPSLKV